VRLALVVERYTKSGGQERAMAAFAEALAPGHELHLLTSELDLAAPSGVQVHLLAGARGPAPYRFLSFRRAAEARLRRLRPDLSHGIGANCPVADVVHLQTVNREKYGLLGTPPSLRGGLLGRLSNRLYLALVLAAEKRSLSRHGPVFIAVSRRVGGEARRHYGVRVDELRRIPNGYDPEDFDLHRARAGRAATRQRLGLEAQDLGVLFVGPDHGRKGLDVLMQAFSRAKIGPSRLLVAGGAPGWQHRYAELATSLGVAGRVSFLPHHPDLCPCYGAADLLVLPTKYDPFGMVVVEAMACGLPVVVSGLAGVTEYLKADEAELLQDPRDARELQERLEDLARSQERRQALAQRGLKRAQAFRWCEIVPMLEDAYRAALDRKLGSKARRHVGAR
jgi:UDP-glucose:(heptosyl)LPS alpha-1,3-glucosyltransferase